MLIRKEKFEVVDSFRYLGGSISQSHNCFEATTDSENGLEEFGQFASNTDK